MSTAAASVRRVSLVVVALLVATVGIGGARAYAANPAAAQPWIKTYVSAVPKNLAPGEAGVVDVASYNLGDASLEQGAGHKVKIVTSIPTDWAVGTATVSPFGTAVQGTTEPCAVSGTTVTCEPGGALLPFQWWESKINVTPPAAATTGQYSVPVTVEGARAPLETPASITVSDAGTGFGVNQYVLTPESESGELESQAGAHPFQLTTFLSFNLAPFAFKYRVGEGLDEVEERVRPAPAKGLPREVAVDLPSGLVGDTLAVPKCSADQFETLSKDRLADFCPPDSAIGAADVEVDEPVSLAEFSKAVPVFNLEPSPGEPARFGFVTAGVPVVFDTSVNGGDFHVVVHVGPIPQDTAILDTLLTIWGSPGDPRHDSSRGVDCVGGGDVAPRESCKPFPGEKETRASKPFLDMPTYCKPIGSQVSAQPWTPEGSPFTSPLPAPPLVLTGCEAVPFSPEMAITPTETRASTPTGLKVVLKSPQQTTLEEGKIGEADIRNTKVVFPTGMQLSPSAANGLAACSESAVGFTGNSALGTAEFKHEIAKVESPQEEKTGEEEGRLCPAASKVGKVKIVTPLIEKPLEGSVFLAKQEENPYSSLFGVYVVAKDPTSGVVVKLAGKVAADPNTGQITSEFSDAPQAPFEELELELFNGPGASLATPADCGSYSSTAALLPWSVLPESGSPTALTGGPLAFNISSGPDGTECPAGALPFGLGFSASAESAQAGAFTPFTVVLGRRDEQQQPTNLTMTLPPGIAGMLSQVKQCPEPQANAGTCGPESLIGSASAVVGLGSSPFSETGGRVYITGPYAGAPFGLSVVLPAKAGPFEFGYVVTRSKIFVNQTTAQLTISSNLPTMVNTLGFPGTICPGECKTGVPVQLRQVVVKVERPGNAPFEFNPTNCSPMAITGSITGNEGAVQAINEPFQVKNCQSLPFKPEFTVETGANYTRTEGTFLKVTVKARPGEANIAKTKLVFPLQLPSRNTTLQQACLAATFEKNPALCPPAAAIGTAIARTPVLNSPLIGPAYLVSHGGEAFPDVVFVLQGEGITLLLDGKTNIHNGITSSTFESVPDAPVSSFEVNLPKKQFSAFTGYENLCEPTKTETKKVTTTVTVGKGKHKKKKKVVKTEEVKTPVPGDALLAPATLTGQNGNVIKEEIKVKVAECKKVASFKKAKPKPKKKKKKGKKATHKGKKKH